MPETINNEPDDPLICDRCLAHYPGELKECPECGRTLCPDCWGDKKLTICKQCDMKRWI